MSIPAEIHTELERAQTARIAGNEGQARVCARRAAGLAAREFLNQHGVTPFDRTQASLRSRSTIVALQALSAFPGLAPSLKEAALHLTMTVSGEFHLPPGIDLINDAQQLIEGLK